MTTSAIKRFLVPLPALALLWTCMAGCMAAGEEGPGPLVLWYTRPAQEWTDALPVGNGRLGAMIFGGVSRDRIQFNEETFWTGRPRDYNRKDAVKYLPQIRKLLSDGR